MAVPPAPTPPTPLLDLADDPLRQVRRLIARQLFAVASVVALLTAAMFAMLPAQLAKDGRWPLVLAFGALGLLAAGSMRARRRRTEDLVAIVLVAAIAAIALAATLLGWGIASPGIGFFGLLVCLVGAVAGPRWGGVAAGLSGLAVLGLALAHGNHWLPLEGTPLPAASLGLRTGIQLFLVGAGFASGWLIWRVVTRHVHSAEEREQRFRSLLAIAADAYWEIDAQYRLVIYRQQRPDDPPLGTPGMRGRVPWELPEFEIDDETLDLLRAHLEAREPFRDLALRWRDSPSRVRHLLMSGEPRLGGDGAFLGYWGVVHDISADVQARQALALTESRYQDLFARIPTPLVLHAGGRVLDANPAALDMFGCAEPEALIGQDLLGCYDGGDSRERARRAVDALEGLPPGEALPVAEYRLVARDGRRLVARATTVRVEGAAAGAGLTIFVDDTERKRAEDAVRRSEAMLSHLVATSPDVITLTELGTGRHAMVNRTFERLTGYAAAEVEGRTAAELGLWRDMRVYERFVAAIRDDGAVQDLPAEFVTKTGTTVSVRVSGARFAMDRRDYLVVNARDVTDTERARLEREAILQNASIGIAVTRDRRFVLANPCFEQMYGWPPGELLGRSGRVVWASDEDYREVGATLGPALARGEAATIEARVMRADGSTFLARVRGTAIDPADPAHSATLWIVDDVTEQRNVEQALARARDAAETANRAKSAFLATTSHELRTPLGHLLGLARLAAAPQAEPAAREAHLVQIVETAQALSAIIGDILDLSKIEAGRLELDPAPFDLGAMLAALQRDYQALAEPRGLALRLEVGAGVTGAVRGDELRVRQILSNFLSNALKFTEAGSVRLKAWRLDAERVRFEVHDSGPGIDKPTQARLFAPFTQADQSIARRYGGTGLGLSICRELADLMGGVVGVTSRPGEGSCFWAELPLPPAAAAAAADPAPMAAPAAPAAPVAATAPEAAAGRTPLAGARVLVVDDDVTNRFLAEAYIQGWGGEVELAEGGEQAIAKVQAAVRAGRPYDVVLMDVMMPAMSGEEATRCLRRDLDARTLPIVAWTAAALATVRDEALAAGMNDYALKPIQEEQLRSTLQRWTRRPGAGS
jgi:PAS domain S-box-containing protein